MGIVTESTDLFLNLTPERVLAAVEAGGMSTRPLCYPLNSFENRVYEIELVDASRVVAKFYRPGRWGIEQILEEHRFMAELAADEIAVTTVLPFPDGSTVKQIDGIYYCLAPRCGGRAPDELSDAKANRLGMLVGRLHNVAARHPAEHRVALTPDVYIRDDIAWLTARGCLPPHLEQRYVETAEEIAELTDRLLAGVAVHRLHGDLHLGNLLERDGVLRLVDFDDMVTGPAVQDVWLAFPGRDAHARHQREQFLAGYEQFRLFDRSTLRLIEPLRALRLVHYATWLARRWHDPIFKVTWPQFGSEEYWRQETEALEEVLGLIHCDVDPPVEISLVDAALEQQDDGLTNRDFFWDWEGG